MRRRTGGMDVASIAASETHIGEIGASSAQVDVTPTITAGAYSADDVVGGKQTLSDVARVSAGEAILQSIVVTDLGMQDAALKIFLFNADPTNGTYTDNSALDIDDTDLGMCIGVVEVASADYVDASDNSVAAVSSIGLGLTPASGTDLYAVIKTTGTPTYASTSDLTFKFFVLRD